jgi:PadR family transcriptional regulator, regulatory protein PadR
VCGFRHTDRSQTAEAGKVAESTTDSYARFPITNTDIGANLAVDGEHQEILGGLIRLHILHHAVEGELYGHWMIEELARHGYKVSPGTLYPMLHALERKGYLKSKTRGSGRRARRIYRATTKGRNALEFAKDRVRELFGELIG